MIMTKIIYEQSRESSVGDQFLYHNVDSAVILKRETRCESLLCLAQCTSLTINMVEQIIKSTLLKIDKNGFN